MLKDVIDLYRTCGFDLIIVETAGIGQSDSEIVDLVDFPVYVMTSEYGAASQLEKIEMLDFADFIVLNKSEKRGAEDSLRDVRKQWRRNHAERARGLADAELPVSRSGGLFDVGDLLLAPFEAALTRGARRYRLIAARLPPDAGAALHAAKLCGMPLATASVAALEVACQREDEYPGSTG